MKPTLYAHFLYHALMLRLKPAHSVPLTMNVQVTHRCPNQCRYCSYDRDEKAEMSLADFRQLFQEAWNLGGRRVGLTGGEPFIREDLYEIVRAAKDLGFFISISTSGSGAEKQLEALKLCDQVMLSCDGPPEVSAYLCGERAAQDAVDAVRLFQENDIPFWTTSILCKTTIPHLDWIVDQARKNKTLANFVLLHTQSTSDGTRFHPRTDEVAALVPDDDELRRALLHLLELKRKGAPIGSSTPYLKALASWPDYSEICLPDQPKGYRCLAGRASCELTADGLLYPCGWARDCMPGESILDGGFARAFKALKPIPNCNSCASSCWLESNLIFSLNSRALAGWVQNLLFS